MMVSIGIYTSTPMALLSLDIGRNNIIYAGGVNDFGYFDYLENKYQFISLARNEKYDDLFFKTLVTPRFVFFLSEKRIIRYEFSKGELRIILNPVDEYFLSLFELSGSMFAQSESHLYRLNDFILEPAKFQLPRFLRGPVCEQASSSGRST